MRFFSIIFIFLSLNGAGVALACPDFSGEWHCKNSDESTSIVKVDQENLSHGVLYRVTDQQTDTTTEYPADGEVHPFQDGDVTGTVVITCTDEQTVDSIQEVYNDKIGLHGKIEQRVYLSNSNQLMSSSHTWIQLSGSVQEKTIDSVCTKNPPTG